ncbi:MAG: site-specific DNA-methyltransferase, partial [Hyphomicrobiaceae bacterium]
MLRESVTDESVDPIFLDPPFNSNAIYNVLFRGPSGDASQAQIEAFEDTWHWNNAAERAFDEVMQGRNADVANMLRAMRSFLNDNDMMAYLTHMAVRLVELHRVLKPTGSIYLHCDPTASHYLKVLMDAVFGSDRHRNEIIWKRTSGHSDATRFGSVHDTTLYYAKTDASIWNDTYQAYDSDYVERYYRYRDDDGRRFMSGDAGASGLQGGGYEYEWKGISRIWRLPIESMKKLDSENRIFYTRNGFPRIKRYLDEAKGMPTQDVWTDLESLRSWHQERLGYPTQKPVALLERILSASSNPGDVVLDPFCGCGTTVHAAEKLGRQWIGIDVTHLSISLIEKRLKDAFPGIQFEVHGTPKDLEGARDLSARDKYQFQWWAVSLVDAVPYGGKKKGADGGIDGHIFFRSGAKTTEKAIVSVKGGGVGVKDIRELIAVVDRERAKIGVYISLEPHTEPMKKEAAGAGLYDSGTGK